MAERAVTLERREIQGLVASGFSRQKAADFLLLTIDDAAGAMAWLSALWPRITTSDDRTSAIKRCIAFTAPGLLALGVPAQSLASFARPFREGMVTPHRQRILGDLAGSPSDPAGWLWGGPRTPRVDAVLMIYAPNRAACDEAVASERQAIRGARVERVLPSVSLSGREHFGFTDGLSNPFTPGLHGPGPFDDMLPPGELVLGYDDLSGSVPPGPAVPAAEAPDLPACPTDPQQADFGRNGTYLVLRQIEQDVRAFWEGLVQAAEAAGLDRSAVVPVAAKMIGRSPDGSPLSTVVARDPRGRARLTFADDRDGLRCPIGAHIRRANPRDALLENPEQSLGAVQRHRLLRRGRAYGRPAPAEWYPPGVYVEADDQIATADEEARGLYFVALCADIERQFEFVEQTWLGNRKFGGLFDSADILSATRNAGDRFTIPGTPVRLRLGDLPAATRTVGGAYFFLPSRSALRYLAGAGARRTFL